MNLSKLEEVMNNPNYEHELNMDKNDYVNKECYDDWGVAFTWLNDDIGVEYNICFDGNNCSAIYRMYIDKEDGYMYTDYSDFIHYEIDFNDDNWERKLEVAMCEAMIQLCKL